MSFFERWFALSPDGGNGMVEAVWVAALVAVGAAVLFRPHALGVVQLLRRRMGHRRLNE